MLVQSDVALTPVRPVLFVVAMLLGYALLAVVEAQSRPAAPVLSKAQWRDDVRYFARELPKRHKNLYHATTKEQFEKAVADLDAAIASLQDHQIIVKLRQVAATVGDGHTGVQLPAYFKRYPLNIYWFGGELRVIAAAKEYEGARGARIIKIGDLDIDEVSARVATCFPSKDNENEWFVLNTGPALMMRPEVLHALGVVSDPARAAFTVQHDDGRVITLDISPVVVPAPVNGVVALGLVPVVQPPLSRQRPGEAFWFTFLQDKQTAYANFRRYPSLKQNARAFFDFIDRNPTQRVVIDLRQNGGGDFFEGRAHLVEPIKKRPAINQKGRLFVAVGRQTFSAAMVNAIDFRKETNAILVGEPIGERPNSYSENDEMTLQNSKLVVSYSTRYYKFVDQDVAAVLPDVHIEQTWADFRTGRDGVIDWVLGRPIP